MTAPALPATLAPPAPFPLVVAQSATSEFVAPGVRRGTYRIETSDGPLVVHVVAVDPHEPTVRFGTVLATDRLVSPGETVSAMARRTGAVAGINADYFDIGNTNQPLNVLVRDGALLRTPSKRVAVDVRTDRSVHFENIAFGGTVTTGATTIPLTGVNEWPPQGGASFLNATFGSLRPASGVRIVELVPVNSAHEKSRIGGVYRVASSTSSAVSDEAAGRAVRGPLLALGPSALALAPPPAVGDALTIEAATTPALEEIACAVGGGPMLLANGALAGDPNEPAPEEHNRRFPVAGAATLPDGEVLLVSVDGRQSALSIGVTRPQFSALFQGFGATNAMAFDSGGSATLVARVLGEPAASVLGSPSDGEERNVADGLFVYSDAPVGPAAQLVVRPSDVVALPNVNVPVRAALVDAAGHALGAVRLTGGDVIAVKAAPFVADVRAANLHAAVPVAIVARLARLDLAANARNPDAGATVRIVATGFDARGRVVALGDVVRFTADRGRVAAGGRYRVPARDARIVATAGGRRATLLLHVGRRRESLTIFDAMHRAAWRFAAAPSGAPGAVVFANDPAELQLAYDFSGDERAAYANAADLVLPGDPMSFGVEINGNARGIGVRALFENRLGEQRVLTLAKNVDWSGWQTRTINLPNDLNPPVRLVSLYAVDSLGTQATHSSGTLAFRNPSVVIAGNP